MIISVRITGVCGLLQHRFAIEKMGINAPTGKKKVYDPDEEAETATYRGADGNIFCPSTWVKAAMSKAGTKFKYEGRTTFKSVIPACVLITPAQIPLLNPETSDIYKAWDEIHTEPAVVNRARIVRWRPQWNEWALESEMENLDPDMIAPSTLNDILASAGKFYGVGDRRPDYGRFHVTKFEVQHEQPMEKAA